MLFELTRDPVPEVSIVVPCYNEGSAIVDVIDRIMKYLDSLGPRVRSEVVVVDDGSSDATHDILQNFSTKYPASLRCIQHERNAGLTQAMRTGAEHARNDTVIFLDADLSYAPEIIGQMLSAKMQTGAGVVLASPYMSGGRVGNVPFVRLAASRGANALLSLTMGRKIRTFTGMVRAYDRDLFNTLAGRVTVGEFNSAMVAEVLKAGCGVVEIPAALIWPLARTASPSRISLAKLGERARLVLDTWRILAREGKGSVKIGAIGSLGLVTRPKGPYASQ